jgi:riboflavin synthase alpha subunit
MPGSIDLDQLLVVTITIRGCSLTTVMVHTFWTAVMLIAYVLESVMVHDAGHQ